MHRLVARLLSRATPPPMPARQRPIAEAMEPRLLYSADLLPAGLDANTLSPDAEIRLLETEPATETTAEATVTARSEVLFIDRSLPDGDGLHDTLLRANPTLEVIWLDAQRDGIAQISDALAGRNHIDAIHLITHGADGQLALGNTTVDSTTLSTHASAIAAWGNALSDDADLLLYGCDVAGSPVGQAFLSELAALTGADVAASDDATGAGGNWLLERQVGILDTATLNASSWQGTLALTATGGDIDVNTNDNGNQQEVSVAMFNDGGWVAVWTDESTDTIKAKIYNANGSIRTPEYRVDQGLLNLASAPDVATDGSGRFVVAYTSNTLGAQDIYFRLFDLNGTALTGSSRVNASYTAGDQNNASVDMTVNGEFVVTWDGAGSGDSSGVFAQRFDKLGGRVGGVLQVNQTTADSQSSPDVAIGQNGQFVVAWQDESSGKRIFARQFSAAGVGGSEFLVQTRLTGSANSPTVGMAADGSYTIAWAESNADGNNYGILMRRFNSAGTALGNDEQVNLTSNNRQDEPDIAMLTSGDFVITWASQSQDGNNEGVFLRAFTDSGVAASGELAVNQYTSGSQDHPAIAMNNAGELVVTWVGQRAIGDNDDINARRFSWPEGGRLNTAPVLDDSATPALDAITEDSGIPSGAVGTLIDDLVSLAGSGAGLQNVTDTDAGATTGIALLAAEASHGSWYYSLDDGASWTLLDATTLGSANALLLAADGQTRLAFSPVADFNSASGDYPEIRFRAWDRNSGTNGGFADTTGNGGNSAFSVATDSARLTVSAVNDPPVITTNLLVIGEGQTVVLSPAMLAGTDVEDAPGTLLYSVTSVTGGFFARVASPTNATMSFTQQEVIDGAIQFVHDGGEAAPTYTLTLTDTEDLSSAPSAANIAFSYVNDAPMLTDVPLSFSILQNNGAPTGVVGVRITTLVTLAGSGSGPQNVSDDDIGALAGIAITAADTTHGTWYYSIDDGANWQSLDLAGLPAGEARLLAADARTRLYFEHTDAVTGTITNSLVFHAWDGSSGSNGGSANPLPGGGSTAFSTATDSVDLVIVDVNDAPVLDTNLPVTVVATEDAPAPVGAVGFTTYALVSFAGSGSGAQNTTDADAGALSGVALIGANTTGGNWWYSLDGGNNWAQLPAGLSDTNALLMANDGLSRLYFQSTVANAFGTTPAALSFKAWDQTAGSDGQMGVDTTTGTAFSANSHSATLDLQAVNDAPTVNTNTLAISEGGTVILGTANLASSDVESAASSRTYTIATVSGGRFAWASAPGVAITSFTQADIDANLVQFEHDGGEAPPAYTLTLSDGAAAVGPFAGSVSFTPVNDRPVLTATGNATLSLDEDSALPVGAVGVPVDAMVGLNGTGPANVTDPDSNPIGIAINYADSSNGQWFYSLDNGTTWQLLGPVSGSSARLLLADGNTRIGFAPTPGYNGTTPAALHFHAWDGSSGAHGGLGDPGTGSAFSTADDTLTLIVRPVNDAPTVVPVALVSGAEDTPRRITQAELLVGASDLEGDPLVATDLAITSGSGTLANNGDGSWTFTPATDWSGAVTFSFVVDDGTDRSPNTATLLITPVNDAPTVTPPAAQTITTGGGFEPLAFTIGDAESAPGTLIVTARSSNPAVLPDSAIVLSGSGATRSISITPGHPGGSGVAQIILEVSDGAATTTGQFSVTAPAASTATDTPAATPPSAESAPDAVAAPPPTTEPPTPDAPAGSAAPAPPPETPALTPALIQDAPLAIQNTVPSGEPVDTIATDNPPGNISTLSISLSTTDVLALLYTPSEAVVQTSAEGQISSALREARLEQAFAQLRQGADEEAVDLQQGIGVSVVTGAGLTIGYVAWLIRGGVLLTSLLSTMPAWRLLDPLPILNSASKKRGDNDDDSLESMVDQDPDAPDDLDGPEASAPAGRPGVPA
ncbi:MAG: DUF4347 domain-containing protein [Denitromonas halophila]|nr:MAG: DUF4347 domain-containing protein [Denitromonas halophila]TVT68303.1 MAG: DUF4347 domain-containing protein [Denitromonas halophila]